MSSAQEAIDRLLHHAPDGQIVVGPVVWQEDEDGNRTWYFVAFVAGPVDGCSPNGLVIEVGDDRARARDAHAIFLVELASRPSLVVHAVDSELGLARLCDTLWPSEITAEWRKEVEQELQA
jgi:hypothetical protein